MPSIFSEEWRDCLRAHYTYVVRMGDHGTERTLRIVMSEAGFGEDEVKQLYVLATAHVDDVGADFVPDMQIFEQDAPVMVAVAMPEELVEAMVIEDALESDDEADIESELEIEAEADETDEDEPPPQDDPGVTQLSLF